MSKKKLPYGNSNFADLIERGFAYVDKTRYIELLEDENNGYQYLLRPRRFGKSLFLSMMENYYDRNKKDKFKSLFGDLYIGKFPTPEQGKYAIMKFDFSVVRTDSRESFYESFSNAVQESVCNFFNGYQNIFTGAADEARLIKERNLGVDALLAAYGAAKCADVPVFVIIDEYDNFASDLVSMGEAYKDEVTNIGGKDGIVRTFYKSLKSATTSSVRRIFITGVSPMMVNDLTSGFNIATDYSRIPRYNEAFGFTRDEVEWLMDETGIDRSLINVDMEYYYNGYMFDSDGLDKVYNSQMVLFLFNQIKLRNKQPTEIVDDNLRTNYQRLRNLAGSEPKREMLLKIMVEGGIYGKITGKFTLDTLSNDENFVSLLFYLGMLTCGETVVGQTYLKIPNFSIKTLYWEYIAEYTNSIGKIKIDTSELLDTVRKMALDGDIKPYLDFFVENQLKRISNRDLMAFDEKYVKLMMLSTLYMSNSYVPIPEAENVSGYTDIYLQRTPASSGEVFEYVLELKYVKTGAGKKEKDSKFAEALAQIEKYKEDKRFAGRSDLKFVAVVFAGKGMYEFREVF